MKKETHGKSRVGKAILTPTVAQKTQNEDDWQEHQCSPGIFGTGIACNPAPHLSKG